MKHFNKTTPQDAMRAIPLLMSAPMVRALWDGRKTQTRRLCKPANDQCLSFVTANQFAPYSFGDEEGEASSFFCPYGVPGDLLWVRETWRSWRWNDALRPKEMAERWADNDPRKYVGYDADNDLERDGISINGKTRVSIHMPRWASRLTLRITDVRVERLQEISEVDALAEGVFKKTGSSPIGDIVETWDGRGECIYTLNGMARTEYRDLWESINGPGSWNANPWVWVVMFEVLRMNIKLVLDDGIPAPAGHDAVEVLS